MSARFRSSRGPVATFAVVVVTGTIALVLLLWCLKPVTGAHPKLSVLTNLQVKAIDVDLERNKMVITLALLVFAGFGTLLTGKGARPLRRSESLLTTLSVAAAAVSLFASYLHYDKLVEMLAAAHFAPESELLAIPRSLQIWALLTSLFLFGCFFLRRVTEPPAEEPPAGEPTSLYQPSE